MKLISHHNIIAMLGCNTTIKPYFIVIEYAQLGDLEKYLNKKFDKV